MNGKTHFKSIALVVGFLGSTMGAKAQTDEGKPLAISGYIEAYYSFDFNRPADHNKPGFLYSHNRNNEINVNLGLIKAGYQTKNLRANLALAAGTYMHANYSAEPTVMKNIYEANIGVKISKNNNLWMDAGMMPSHIGFESAIGKDNWTVTRGLYAENTPYFNTGAKISYTSNDEKWALVGVVMNGWQRIYRTNGNNSPAFGHQIVYKPNTKVTLNSSSFIGNDKVDSLKQMRYFHHFYGTFQLSEKFAVTTGFDIGAEQKSKGNQNYNIWYTPAVVMKYSPNSKHNFAARAEYYNDKHGVIVNTGTPNGFQTFGYSINYDYCIADNVMWRIEGRSLNSKDKIFITKRDPDDKSFFITTSLAVSF